VKDVAAPLYAGLGVVTITEVPVGALELRGRCPSSLDIHLSVDYLPRTRQPRPEFWPGPLTVYIKK